MAKKYLLNICAIILIFLARVVLADDVPIGFEHITEDFKGPVTLIYSDKAIADANIEYVDAKDKIILSKKAIDLILKAIQDNIKQEYVKQIKAELRQPLDANTDIANKYIASSTTSISCYYDIIHAKLYVFLPPQYQKKGVKKRDKIQYHPDVPIANPAITGRVRFNFDKFNNEDNNIALRGAAAAGPLRLVYDVNNYLTDNFNDLYLQYFSKKLIYRAGYQEPISNDFLAPNGNIWGISIAESTKLINNKFYREYSAPLLVALDNPAFVKILLRGEVLYQGTLAQRENIIKTDRFPNGSYQVEIRKQDLVTGEESSEYQMFFGGANSYNWMYSGFEVVVGRESTYFGSIHDDNATYIRVKNGYNFYKGNIDLSYTHAEHNNYLGFEYDYLPRSDFDIVVSGLINEKANLYFATYGYYRQGNSTYRINFSNGFDNYFFGGGRQKNVGLFYNYNYQDWRLQLHGRYHSHDSYNLYSRLNKSIILSGFPSSAYLSLGHSSTNNVIALFGLRLNLSKNKLQTRASINYNNNMGSLVANIYNSYTVDKSYLRSSINATIKGDQDSTWYANGHYNTSLMDFNANMNMSSSGVKRHSIGFVSSFILSADGILLTSDNIDAGYVVDLPKLGLNKKEYYKIEQQQYHDASRVYVKKRNFMQHNLALAPNSPLFKLNYNDNDKFFYPGNIVFVKPTVINVCFVSFVANISDEQLYTLKGYEQDLYNRSGARSLLQMVDGDKLVIKTLTNPAQSCDSGYIVKCKGKSIDLGEITCKDKSNSLFHTVVKDHIKPPIDLNVDDAIEIGLNDKKQQINNGLNDKKQQINNGLNDKKQQINIGLPHDNSVKHKNIAIASKFYKSYMQDSIWQRVKDFMLRH